GRFGTLYKLVKAKYKSTRPVEDLDLVLWNDLKTMFEPHVEDNILRNQQDYKVLSWKLYDSCGVHFLRMQAQEQEELSVKENATLFQQLLEKIRKHFAAKRAEEKRNKPPTKTQQRKIMCTYLKSMEGYKFQDLKLKGFDSIQEMFDRAFKRLNTFEDFRTELVEGKEKRAGIELAQEVTKKQKVEDDKETTKIKKLIEIIPDEEEVAINDIPLAVKSPSIVDWKNHKEGRKSYYQIIRADRKSQMYMIISHMFKSFDREDLETLYKLVKAKYESTRPVEDLDLVLWNDLKTMFEPHVEDNIWRNQQDYKVGKSYMTPVEYIS
ncbi:hypothetical protein Tco_1453913, partial [Tanacetum coccineum]